jgi:2-phosphoglycerate kinase
MRAKTKKLPRRSSDVPTAAGATGPHVARPRGLVSSDSLGTPETTTRLEAPPRSDPSPGGDDAFPRGSLSRFSGREKPGAAGGAARSEDRIDVTGRDGRWPFNQGRLMQSLYPTGLEPEQALACAVEIERGLRQASVREVSRDELRERVYALLEREHGIAYARRYRVWREFQNQDAKPLILLLGGTSGVGKSSLAIEVARRLSIARVLSTDAIRDVMRVMISDDLVPTLHVSSFEAHHRLVMAVAPGLDPIVEGFLDQSRTVAVGVRAVIERAIIEGTNTVIDGVSLVPGLYDLAGWGDRAHVVLLLAADDDLESLRAHIVARAHGRGARASERYLRSFEEIVRIQEALLERARSFGVEVIDVKDLEEAVRHVVSHVVGGLAASLEAKAGLD